MKNILFLIGFVLLFSCKSNQTLPKSSTNDFTLVFASCNHQNMEQPLWKPIIESHPNVFVWGGDNIYADTNDAQKMKNDYEKTWENLDYKSLANLTTVIGTWDDHDYGKNDAGEEWIFKEKAQQLFLDFLKVPQDDVRRERKGVYNSHTFNTKKGLLKVILLDTRYFRSPLKKSPIKGVRYEPWKKGEGGTVLGNTQWKWLANELLDEKPSFTVIVSSIQFLANEHNWEKWGNHPDEVDKMYKTIEEAKSKNIILLSGDRHLAEFSRTKREGMNYPIIDFTSSGLTKTYPNSPDDPNRYRVGKQIKELNFGVIQFNFKKEEVIFKIKGRNNVVLDSLIQKY